MDHVSTAENGRNLQSSMTSSMWHPVLCMHSQMAKLKRESKFLKQLLKKAADSGSDPYLTLLSYRASPLECALSPAELLMNRKLRTTLQSYMKQKRRPKLEQKLQQQKMKQKSFYDRTAKQLPLLSTKDTVRIEVPDGWRTKATVLQEVAPRSFAVRTEEGQIFILNHCSLLKTQETVPELSEAHNESESISQPPADCNTNTHTPGEPVVRRSTREIRKSERLNLWLRLKKKRKKMVSILIVYVFKKRGIR